VVAGRISLAIGLLAGFVAVFIGVVYGAPLPASSAARPTR
jgi:ABC-type dipeptide/oligopeptide/nickel transport system permease subunit